MWQILERCWNGVKSVPTVSTSTSNTMTACTSPSMRHPCKAKQSTRITKTAASSLLLSCSRNEKMGGQKWKVGVYIHIYISNYDRALVVQQQQASSSWVVGKITGPSGPQSEVPKGCILARLEGQTVGIHWRIGLFTRQSYLHRYFLTPRIYFIH